jgi:FkbM family methyltransferase
VIEAETDLGTILLEADADLVTPYVLEHGTYAPELGVLLRNALEPGMTFVDAGANIGYFSLLASKLVGERGRVFSVEPDERNVSILEANLSRHGCANATVLPLAAWTERTELTIRPNPEGGAGVAVATNEPDLDRIPAARLDELIDGRVDVLKVDCEVTDHLVVSGAEGLIRANPTMLITVEYFPRDTSHTGHTPRQILELYEGLGLRPYEIEAVEQVQRGRELRGGLRPTSYERLAAARPPGEIATFDFALSRELPERLLARPGALGRARAALPRRAYLAHPSRNLRARILKGAGDLLEHVPARVRPPIRHRDRRRSGTESSG